jgi:hypothetical protein
MIAATIGAAIVGAQARAETPGQHHFNTDRINDGASAAYWDHLAICASRLWWHSLDSASYTAEVIKWVGQLHQFACTPTPQSDHRASVRAFAGQSRVDGWLRANLISRSPST